MTECKHLRQDGFPCAKRDCPAGHRDPFFYRRAVAAPLPAIGLRVDAQIARMHSATTMETFAREEVLSTDHEEPQWIWVRLP